jgi:hypothetical protein
MKVRELLDHAVPLVIAQPRFGAALTLLLEARLFAEQTGVHPWEFAVEIQELCGRGLSVNDLRLLVRLKYVVHAIEVTNIKDLGRRFQRSNGVSFTSRTCFILTNTGRDAIAAIPKACSAVTESEVPTLRIVQDAQLALRTAIPQWNPELRLLSLDGIVVKQFRWPAANQERILTSFQEERWPARILDPLSPNPVHVAKQRLSETIRSLNRGHMNSLLRFRGDGTGEGVIWQAVG